MQTWDIKNEQRGLEDAIQNGNLDFSAEFMFVQNLHLLIKSHAELVRPVTVSALQKVLEESRHTSQTQSFFLYREAAETIADIMVCSSDKNLSRQSISSLKTVMNKGSDMQKRAAAEAIGSLPLSIRGPETREQKPAKIPFVTWNEILKKTDSTVCNTPEIFGRSLAAEINNSSTILVIKFARSEKDVKMIKKEAEWMNYLSSCCNAFPVRFKIPQPVNINGSYVFRMKSLPVKFPAKSNSNKGSNYAIGYMAHKDYFIYPNEEKKQRRLEREQFREVILRNAWLFGRLTSMGIVHLAPIPLFHNRVQQNRRNDGGAYEWRHGGRLDRWLYSCRHPNFGKSGIRDFEHLMSYQGSSLDIYTHIGSHILSMLIVTASYFRNFESDKVGFDEHGKAVDVRYLFDESFLKDLIKGIFSQYYLGFVEKEFEEEFPFDFDMLTSRMIDEMGIDNYMEEILRVVDQAEMTEKDFIDFLSERGFSKKEIESYNKNAEDITLNTGPHLGGFNQRISLPELIQYISVASACCIAGKYFSQKTNKLSR
jgi:hypothetical protein